MQATKLYRYYRGRGETKVSHPGWALREASLVRRAVHGIQPDSDNRHTNTYELESNPSAATSAPEESSNTLPFPPQDHIDPEQSTSLPSATRKSFRIRAVSYKPGDGNHIILKNMARTIN